jgi:hypothetical protein
MPPRRSVVKRIVSLSIPEVDVRPASVDAASFGAKPQCGLSNGDTAMTAHGAPHKRILRTIGL